MLYINLYRSNQWDESETPQTSQRFIYIMYGIHALPYLNSAFNWLLYGKCYNVFGFVILQ